MGCIVYTDYVCPAFVPLLADITFEKVLLFCLSFPLLFHHAFFHLLSSAFWPFRTRLLICLIRAAIFIPLVVCICLHPDALSSVVLISIVLYQSATFVFLDGSRVSEGLVMVNLVFHLFGVGTVILALCSDDRSRPLLCCRQ